VTSHTPRVLTRLVCATDLDIVDALGRKARPPDGLTDNTAEQVIWTNSRKTAGMAAEGGTRAIENKSLEHLCLSFPDNIAADFEPNLPAAFVAT
jgi:hypothetical protein